jgi:hypothetical protein
MGLHVEILHRFVLFVFDFIRHVVKPSREHGADDFPLPAAGHRLTALRPIRLAPFAAWFCRVHYSVKQPYLAAVKLAANRAPRRPAVVPGQCFGDFFRR